jgi:hypothetical protein
MAYANKRTFKNPFSVEIDTVEFKDQVWKARLVPDQPVQTQRTFGGVDVDTDSPTWVLELTGHNYRGTGGLVKAIDDAYAAGETMEIVLQPEPGTGKEVATVTVMPVAVEFGGEVGEWKQFEIELPVLDQPVFSTSA